MAVQKATNGDNLPGDKRQLRLNTHLTSNGSIKKAFAQILCGTDIDVKTVNSFVAGMNKVIKNKRGGGAWEATYKHWVLQSARTSSEAALLSESSLEATKIKMNSTC
jgi:hypothetical protein